MPILFEEVTANDALVELRDAIKDMRADKISRQLIVDMIDRRLLDLGIPPAPTPVHDGATHILHWKKGDVRVKFGGYSGKLALVKAVSSSPAWPSLWTGYTRVHPDLLEEIL